MKNAPFSPQKKKLSPLLKVHGRRHVAVRKNVSRASWSAQARRSGCPRVFRPNFRPNFRGRALKTGSDFEGTVTLAHRHQFLGKAAGRDQHTDFQLPGGRMKVTQRVVRNDAAAGGEFQIRTALAGRGRSWCFDDCCPI